MADPRLSSFPRRLIAAERQLAPLWDRVRQDAARSPEARAVVDDTGSWTKSELWLRSCETARAMRRAGVQKNSIVLVQLPNWREFSEIMIATELVGAVFAFCPASWGFQETARALRLTRPSLWFVGRLESEKDSQAWADWISKSTDEGNFDARNVVTVRGGAHAGLENFKDWRELSADQFEVDDQAGSGSDPLEIAITSGTTGDPKGVLHTHHSALSSVQSTIDRQNITSDDIVHVALPIGHTFGYFYGVRCALQAGATLILQTKWNALQAADLINEHQATISLGPSAFVMDMLELPAASIDKLRSLKLFTQSGDSLPGPTIERVLQSLPFRLSRALGMTEFGHAASTDAATDKARLIDSVGSPQPEMKFEIRDPSGKVLTINQIGSIFVSGPFLFAGYLAEDGLNTNVIESDGFFKTGDLGWIGEDGCIHVTGREKNIIRRGAVTVPVAALEDMITSHPSVHHAIVVPVPDLRLGEIAAACIKFKVSSEAISLSDLQTFLEERGMTQAFWPEVLVAVSDWPMGATAKVDRVALIKLASEQKDADTPTISKKTNPRG